MAEKNIKPVYSEETVYIIAYSRLPDNISAYFLNGCVGVGLVINYITGIIEDTSCTLITEEARLFLKGIIRGYNLNDNDIEDLVDIVKKRFHGSSQKSICFVLREVYKKYMKWRTENLN